MEAGVFMVLDVLSCKLLRWYSTEIIYRQLTSVARPYFTSWQGPCREHFMPHFGFFRALFGRVYHHILAVEALDIPYFMGPNIGSGCWLMDLRKRRPPASVGRGSPSLSASLSLSFFPRRRLNWEKVISQNDSISRNWGGTDDGQRSTYWYYSIPKNTHFGVFQQVKPFSILICSFGMVN